MNEADVPTSVEPLWLADLGAEIEAALAAGPWPELPPGAELAEALAALDPSALSDYDLVEYVKAWDRQRRHAEGMLATAQARLARREVFEQCAEPDDLCGKQIHGPEGHNPLAAAADEIAPALTWTTGYASGQVEFAVELAEQLPATLAAVRAGRIDAYKARIIADQTRVLENQPTLRDPHRAQLQARPGNPGHRPAVEPADQHTDDQEPPEEPEPPPPF